MKQCIQCGYCCTVAPCPFGFWNQQKHQCEYLTTDNQCEIYGIISKHPSSSISPAFGTGCSSTLGNTRREAKLAAGNAGRSAVPDATGQRIHGADAQP